MTTSSLVHHPAKAGGRGTFDLMFGDMRRGYLSYSLPDKTTMIVEYVEVDPSLRGKKMGEQLVGTAVDWARANARRIVPQCSYARAVITRTAAFRDVLKG